MAVKTLRKIRETFSKLDEKYTRYFVAVHRFKCSIQSYLHLENKAEQVPIERIPDIRSLAHDAGYTDTQLLDMFCEEGKAIRKRKSK